MQSPIECTLSTEYHREFCESNYSMTPFYLPEQSDDLMKPDELFPEVQRRIHNLCSQIGLF